MIISFAWTTKPLLLGKKTVTRRQWKDSHAAKFHEGMVVDAYGKLPRSGGRKVAEIVLTHDPYKERLIDMPESDVEAEGGLWSDKDEFIRAFPAAPTDEVWVIRFKLRNEQLELDL